MDWDTGRNRTEKKLFDSANLGTLALKNRLIRAAIWENMAAPGGHPTEKMTAFYEELAGGGAENRTRRLDARGIDGIEISGGDRVWATRSKTPSLYAGYAARIAAAVRAPGTRRSDPLQVRQLRQVLRPAGRALHFSPRGRKRLKGNGAIRFFFSTEYLALAAGFRLCAIAKSQLKQVPVRRIAAPCMENTGKTLQPCGKSALFTGERI
jgi:hypothetical protein